MSASGLSSPLVCSNDKVAFTESDLLMPFPNGGISTDSIQPDNNTKKLPQAALQEYIIRLTENGYIPQTPIDPGTGLPNSEIMAAQDARFHASIQEEYCFYEPRYLHSMKRFLELSTSMNKNDIPEAKRMVEISKKLNLKLNSLLEITNMLSDSRTNSTNSLKSKITSSNNTIESTTKKIQSQYAFLSKDNAVIETQKEMIRYTKEKNESISNQIALFTVMNAFAIGAIYAIARS
jgi:hypothetical protein